MLQTGVTNGCDEQVGQMGVKNGVTNGVTNVMMKGCKVRVQRMGTSNGCDERVRHMGAKKWCDERL